MSIEKKYSARKGVCIATFRLVLPAKSAPEKVHLAGDFNDWSYDSIPMKKAADGSFFVSIELPFNSIHRFRYLIDGLHWENDDAADNYERSAFGSDNSVIIIESNKDKKKK